MLYEFLTAHRDEIIAAARARVAARMSPRLTDEELNRGVPLFLQQLTEALRPSLSSNEEISRSAALHGADRLRQGFNVAQVVHDYGDILQIVTALAMELQAPISAAEFNILSRCLDEAIAQAVTEHARLRESALTAESTARVGKLAHEMRNLLNIAQLSFSVLKSGNVGAAGSTGTVLNRSLVRLRELTQRALAEVRLEAHIHANERFELKDLIHEAEFAGALEASTHSVELVVAPPEPGVLITGDRHLLSMALANLLQNAFKFTPPGGHVWLRARAIADRALIEVEDECGGLPPGAAATLFRPFQQRGADRTGLGLGLSISQDAVAENGGVISVRDLPGQGCIFTIDLPRTPPRPNH
ncbi:MAG TPA: HAMP domain-containing sensor histidine kinase [Polyangiaceae bacterium]|nr:HAMP domain-containing sensor histidine kinase [Polyangiaceae bacterium]